LIVLAILVLREQRTVKR